MNEAFDYRRLIDFADEILHRAGLDKEKSLVVSETLVEADLMGHSTHGLQLLSAYEKDIAQGKMTKTGEPGIINDAGSAITWNGRYLPGPWLVHHAIDLVMERIGEFPVITFAVQKSHHIGCLAAYAERATEKGFMIILSCSDPINKTVAPYGGLRPVYSPNPIAAGIPTEKDPIIFDVSTSTTANGLILRKKQEGKKLDHEWMIDGNGKPTADTEEFFKDPPATLLPLGGLDLGYKGFALGLMVEALTNALGGFGRASYPDQWGCSFFMQVINPEFFGGKSMFLREMQFTYEACATNETRPGDAPVRLPGARALALKKKQMSEGVKLYPSIIPSLEKLGEKYQVSFS